MKHPDLPIFSARRRPDQRHALTGTLTGINEGTGNTFFCRGLHCTIPEFG